MSSSSSSKKKQEEELKRCGFCGRDDLALKNCSGCGSVAYCDAKCQTADWPSHKTVCNRIKKEKKAQQDQLLAALMTPPQPQRYDEVDLFNACLWDNHDDLSKMVRQNGLDLNFADLEDSDGMTAACISAFKGHDKCLSLLAQNRADLSKQNKDGWAPIHMTCQFARHACLLVLLDNEVDANLHVADEDGYTPAMMACIAGHVKILALLLDRRADPNLVDKNGMTAAHKASQLGHDKCLSLLAQNRADLSKQNKDGWAPIHMTCQFARHACLLVLLDNEVDANLHVADEDGYTPAMMACIAGHVKILALLLDRRADPNLVDKNGMTAAHKASQLGHLKCLELLVKRLADLNMKNVDGETPLDFARMFKQRECIDLLIANGATGMNKEDLRPLSEFDKVCMSASFSTLSDAVLVSLRYCLVLCSLYPGTTR